MASYRILIDFDAEGHALAKKIAHVVAADAELTINSWEGAGDTESTLKFYTADARWSVLRIPS